MFHQSASLFPSSPPPQSARPDPFVPGGGADPNVIDESLPGPSPATQEKEVEETRAALACTAPPELVLDRVMMADSGVLLLVWTDPTGNTDRLRKELLRRQGVGRDLKLLKFEGGGVEHETCFDVEHSGSTRS